MDGVGKMGSALETEIPVKPKWHANPAPPLRGIVFPSREDLLAAIYRRFPCHQADAHPPCEGRRGMVVESDSSCSQRRTRPLPRGPFFSKASTSSLVV